MNNFSENIVNQRFKAVFEELEARRLIKGKSDIAKRLGTYNHVVNSILKGQRNVTVDQLWKLFETYEVNANYLFGQSEDIFLPTAKILDLLPTRSLQERHFPGRQNISMVPGRAMAGYAMEYQDKDFLGGFQKFSIPGLEGELVAFEISGDSMMPTVTNGDIVVCEPLERGEPLRDNQVYVIVTDVVVAKRIQQVKEGDRIPQLLLISDNSTVYKPYEVDLEEIRQILKVKCRLTSYAIG
ncbi:MAG: S24 family peptidase [Saprospirales bacterium]|jgi:phage repressor protein C with HTH and peptisase S24 domain|nr:S24 family peptidase [Saprospirales bacterium]MBK6903562.1 S24 family peptidase [Saprospirales bacterium]MBK7338643.1 S24 family peptidase [Saprospirales bacterium]